MLKISTLLLLSVFCTIPCYAGSVPFEMCTSGTGANLTRLVLKEERGISADLDSSDVSLRDFNLQWKSQGNENAVRFAGGTYDQRMFVSFEHGINSRGQLTYLVAGKGGITLDLPLICNPI